MYKESRESKSTSDGGEERVYEKMDDIDDNMYTFCSSNLMRRRYLRQDLRFSQTGNTAVKNLSEPSEWAEGSSRKVIGVIIIPFRFRVMGIW